MTYAENELLPLGFRSEVISDKKAVLSISRLKIQFNCGCPAYPNIVSLGCPIHHSPEFPGGSRPIEEAKELLEFRLN